MCSEDSFAFKAIQMATVFVIEGLIHAKHSNSLGAWITQLKECFSRHVPVIPAFYVAFTVLGLQVVLGLCYHFQADKGNTFRVPNRKGITGFVLK